MNKNSKVLALKYRRTTYKDLIGQEIVAATIYNSIKGQDRFIEFIVRRIENE